MTEVMEFLEPFTSRQNLLFRLRDLWEKARAHEQLAREALQRGAAQRAERCFGVVPDKTPKCC